MLGEQAPVVIDGPLGVDGLPVKLDGEELKLAGLHQEGKTGRGVAALRLGDLGAAVVSAPGVADRAVTGS